MAQERGTRLYRWAKYDGSNGTAVAAEIPGASIISGGTGNVDLLLDVGGGQHLVPADRSIVWTEYPGSPTVVQVYDPNFTDAQLDQTYGTLCDCTAIAEQIEGLMENTVQAVSGSTNSSGNVTLTWPQAFAAAPIASLALQTSTTQLHSARITALSATSVTVHVDRAPIVEILGINVTAAMVDASGVTVHAVGVGAL